MECAEQKVSAARSDLSIAIEPGGSKRAGRQFDAEYEPGRHILEEAGVHAHDLDVADIRGVEWHYASVGPCVGGQSAVGGGYPHHHAPIAIEVVLEADIVPLGIDFLVGIERRGRTRTADVILVLVTTPEFEEYASPVVLLLWHVKSADVEHAAAAGTGEGRSRRKAEHNGPPKRPAERRSSIAKRSRVRQDGVASRAKFHC